MTIKVGNSEIEVELRNPRVVSLFPAAGWGVSVVVAKEVVVTLPVIWDTEEQAEDYASRINARR